MNPAGRTPNPSNQPPLPTNPPVAFSALTEAIRPIALVPAGRFRHEHRPRLERAPSPSPDAAASILSAQPWFADSHDADREPAIGDLRLVRIALGCETAQNGFARVCRVW
jgi:hypothetical protein